MGNCCATDSDLNSFKPSFIPDEHNFDNDYVLSKQYYEVKLASIDRSINEVCDKNQNNGTREKIYDLT